VTKLQKSFLIICYIIFIAFVSIAKNQEDFIMMLRSIAGAGIGGVLGYLYNKKVGCKSGTCPITSSMPATILYGMLLGLMIAVSF